MPKRNPAEGSKATCRLRLRGDSLDHFVAAARLVAGQPIFGVEVLDPLLLAALRPVGEFVLLHPQRLGRLKPPLGQVRKLDRHLLSRKAGHVVQVAHVDAVGRAGSTHRAQNMHLA